MQLVNDLVNKIEYLKWVNKGSLQFNEFDLTSLETSKDWYWIMAKHWNELSLDNIDIVEFESELTDWWYVLNKKYWNKKVPYTLFVQGRDHSDLLRRLSELKAWLDWINGNLYIRRDGKVYVYEATCTKVQISDFDMYQDFADDVKVEFLFTSPFGEMQDAEITTFVKQTWNFEKIITNSWNYKAFPKIIIIWKNDCNSTKQTITVKDIWQVDGVTVSVDCELKHQDVIIFDYKEKQVLFNNEPQPFDWFMKFLTVWKNVVTFDLVWTVDVEVVILYNKILI